MLKRKSQFSMEYLMVIAFVLVLFVPTLAYLMSNSSETEVEFTRMKVNVLANTIIDEAKILYYSGGYGKRSIRYILPERITAFYLTGEKNEQLVFEMNTPLGKRDLVYFPETPLIFPNPIKDEGGDNKITNLNTIYLLKQENETSIIICTNLYMVDPPCLGLAEEVTEPEVIE
jgi:hypothetical protein